MVQIAVTVAPVQAAPANAKRLSITFYNASLLGEVISLSKHGPGGLGALNREYVLPAGAGLAFILTFDGPDIKNEWGAYGSAATALLVVGETAYRGA